MTLGLRRAEHWARLTTDSQYREVERLLKLPRNQAGTTRLLGPQLFFVDGRSCALQHRVIFENQIYAMHSEHKSPRIIDAGANIGMATLYLKQLFPSAKIDTFEADPNIVEVLQKNIDSFGLHDVAVHHAAVSDKTGTVQFVSSGPDSGYVSKSANQASVAVPAVRLSDWLGEPIDFLKLDIEGAECDVILDCLSHLKNVSGIFVEYHSFAGEPQRLPEMLANLQDAGFRIFVQTDYCPPCPLLDPASDLSMDLRLNVFGTQLEGNSARSRGASFEASHAS